jgi:CRISPR-associated endonuclease/helicase Cas3
MLEQKLPREITVGENTGLTDDARRRDSLQKQIVVGTSTIDVGVDFNINFLVFESTNAGTFLQRLGRLGRVKRDVSPFPKYEAHALLSGKMPWTYSRLAESIKDGEEVERAEQFRRIVQSAFPQENQFEPYIKRWGVLQSVHVIQTLKFNKEKTYHELADELKEHYEQVFDANFEKAKGRYFGISKNEEKGRKIIDEVLAFRGSSPFQVACWDATVQPPAFIDYDLFSLVQTADYIAVTKDEYLREVERHADEGQKAAALDALKHTLGHTGESPLILKTLLFYEEREQLVLWIGKDLSQHKDRIQVLSGLRIQEPHTCPSKSEINAILSRQQVVCYCTKEESRNLRRLLRLPAMFQLFRIRDKYDKEYTIAFGKTALLLDSVMLRYKNKNLDDPIII